jgi:hypothetical protein
MPLLKRNAPDDRTTRPWAGHPLADVLRVVAARDRRFHPPLTSAQPGQSIADLRSRIEQADGADRVDGLARRLADLSLAYRLGTVGAPAITTLAAMVRLPDLSEDNVLVDVSEGSRIDRFSFRRLTFFCLADDPAADHPDAVVVDSVVTLRERFYALYARAWLAELIDAVEQLSPLNEKALWGMVASGWASSAGHLAAATGHPRRAIADVLELLAGEPRTRRSSLAFYIDDRGAGAIVRHWRGVCCLTYRLAGNEMCEGECPLLPGGRLALEGAASAAGDAPGRDTLARDA